MTGETEMPFICNWPAEIPFAASKASRSSSIAAASAGLSHPSARDSRLSYRVDLLLCQPLRHRFAPLSAGKVYAMRQAVKSSVKTR